MNICCPLCGAEEHIVVYKKVSHITSADIVKCDKCGHYYSFFKKDIEADKLYNDEVYKIVENRNSVFDKILTKEYGKVIRKIISFKPQKGYLMDFGSGKGKFGSLAKENGWLVKCVETSLERAAYAKEVYGLDVNTEFYSTGNIFNTHFDVLTLLHVLEHLPRPKPLLKELITQNLKRDALIIIEVPNFSSLQSSIAKDKWMHLDVPRHLSHFTSESLDKICNEIGLFQVKKSFFSIHLGVLGMTDSLLKRLGYKKNIIYELKNKKSISLRISILLILPIAILLEYISSIVGKGGIIRKYFVFKNVYEKR
ncbi:MAG TPA: class I SAM-dependent methyltransferase [Chitinophagaceae bacterium]|nr:class I SAM-dependent methyltransferase [Chitinophagaceae bacterium]